jgi:hypothetical protein
MQNDTSRFTVNIIPLQNIQSNITALSAFMNLSNTLTNLQSMVNYDTKTIYADNIHSFTTDATINFESPTNLSNTSGSTDMGIFDTIMTSTLTISNTLTVSNIIGGTVNIDTISARQYITLSDKTVKSNIREWRAPILETLVNIKPYAFTYGSESIIPGNIGLLAQEVAAVYPQCVVNSQSTLYIKYDSVVAVLLGAVRELSAKVSSLEAHKS